MQFIYWISLICSVQCVFLNEAFTKNWVHYNHGDLKSWELINENQLLAISDDNIIKFNIDNDLSISWKIEVSVDDFIIGEDSIFTFGDSVNVWDKKSGELLKIFNVKPVQYYRAFDGILVLDDTGDLSFINSVRVILTNSISDIKISSGDEIVYILTKDKLLTLNSTLEIEESKSALNFNKIQDFKHGLVKVDDSIYNVNNEYIHKSKNVEIINSNFTYSFHDGKFKVFKDGKEVLNDEFDHSTVKYLDNQFIVSSQAERKVLNFSKFWQSLDENDIILETYPFENVNTKEYLINGKLVSIGVYEETIEKIEYDFVGDKVGKTSYELENYKYKNLSILIDKPQSEQVLESMEHLIEEINNYNVIIRWYKRIQRHLTELGRFVVSKFVKLDDKKVEFSNVFGLEKYLVFLDDDKIRTLDTLTGETVWKQFVEPGIIELIDYKEEILLIYDHKIIKISKRDGEIVGFVELSNFDKIFKIFHEGEELVVIKKGSQLEFLEESVKLNQNLVEFEGDSIINYKVEDNQLSKTWEFSRGKIIQTQTKPFNSHTSIVGIPLHDKSVLHKYLNDTVSVITEEDEKIKFYLLNKEGEILYSHIHDEKVDVSTINLIMDDNWIIYSYFVSEPYEQRLMVIDLFEEEGLTVSSKSFIYPEKITSLTSTSTSHSITIKSIIINTINGNLIEIPKFILNSRRIDDHVMNADDAKDDFKMMPYEPIIYKNNYQVLNHQFKLQGQSKILLKNTNLESTIIICSINNDQIFCNYLQPSLSFDKLNETFDKSKLIITIVIVIAMHLFTKPLLTKKKLNNNWVYSL
ncbi:ER membrane protein complex subunit 1 [[Candida] jaroonii]|uniref:ER membrane protein complex subunit 1 n=1 Tax=[Candida] jaroonii TaxID=467808 RepID=A0ACA9YBU8_9ASCO|nr:ER membrane protein complex subunit 1 [[Candida] jaroonii]